MFDSTVDKIVNVPKVLWMLFWRLSFATLFFTGSFPFYRNLTISLVASLILVLGFNRTIKIFPLINLIRGKGIFRIIGDSDGQLAFRRGGASSTSGGRTFIPHSSNVIETAFANGRITGYEPRNLAMLDVPKGALVVGSPGKGLSSASNMSQKNISLGQMGETNFAKVLGKERITRRLMTLWSVSVPDKNSLTPGPYGTDIDCIVVTGDTVYLIDLKNYKSGDVTYRSDGQKLYTIDNTTGNLVGEPKTMSRNMEMATDIMRSHFPGINFVPAVVFMPTDKGEGIIDDVYWPGNIKAVNLSDMLEHLSLQMSYSPKTDVAKVSRSIRHLIAR